MSLQRTIAKVSQGPATLDVEGIDCTYLNVDQRKLQPQGSRPLADIFGVCASYFLARARSRLYAYFSPSTGRLPRGGLALVPLP
jgi:hypothetical protein